MNRTSPQSWQRSRRTIRFRPITLSARSKIGQWVYQFPFERHGNNSSRGENKKPPRRQAWRLIVSRLSLRCSAWSNRLEVVLLEVLGDLLTEHGSLRIGGAEVDAGPHSGVDNFAEHI